jgi:methanogenic corrinoid protein MtbC1
MQIIKLKNFANKNFFKKIMQHKNSHINSAIKTIETEIEGLKSLIDFFDEKYVKNALKLLVIGGYVKQWSAFNYFKKWFKDRGFNVEVEENNSNKFASFIFEDYAIIES